MLEFKLFGYWLYFISAIISTVYADEIKNMYTETNVQSPEYVIEQDAEEWIDLSEQSSTTDSVDQYRNNETTDTNNYFKSKNSILDKSPTLTPEISTKNVELLKSNRPHEKVNIALPEAEKVESIGITEPNRVLTPDFVRPLFSALISGKNDSNPKWAPNGSILSFERAEEGKQKIVIANIDGTILKDIYYKADTGGNDDFALDMLLPEIADAGNSYNANLAWSSSSTRFVFMSNAGEGNYDIYLDSLDNKNAVRLTREKQKDAQPNWSPSSDQVVFVSGRSGSARIYVMDLTLPIPKLITDGDETYLYPRWSPDGSKIAVMHGTNEDHNILVIENLATDKNTVRVISLWQYDDLSPTWSPDGSKIAFYSNYNKSNDPKVWSIIVVDSNASPYDDLMDYVVASNVVPDVASGPAWLPDGKHIVYVRNDKHDYSPIYIADVFQKKSIKLETGTNINHDVSCSKDGFIAFRAQVNQWDHIFLAKISNIKI